MDEINLDHNLKTEDTLIQIRDKLNKDSIKLWLPPYYNTDTGPSDSDIRVIINTVY